VHPFVALILISIFRTPRIGALIIDSNTDPFTIIALIAVTG